MAVKKRSDGRYSTRVYLGIVDGRKKYKSIYARSMAELKAKESEFRKTLSLGVLPSSKDTFRTWADQLLREREREQNPSEFKTFKNRLCYFYDYIGSLPLNKITQSDIQTAVYDLYERNPSTGKPSAKNTIDRYIHACSSVFEFAIKNQSAYYNPCKFIKAPKQAIRKDRRALTPEERKWVIETEHRAQLPAMIAMLAGLRKGEITALTWDDVDLDNATIAVNKSYDFKACELKPPKTEAGKRIVDIPQPLVDYLRSVDHSHNLVVVSESGKMMTNSAWRALWNSYILDLNMKYGDSGKTKKYDPRRKNVVTIEPFTLHCLRHTFCTIMYEAGIDPLTACKQMGHSDIKTTLEIYTHLDAIYKRNNISKMNAYLAK